MLCCVAVGMMSRVVHCAEVKVEDAAVMMELAKAALAGVTGPQQQGPSPAAAATQ